MLSLFYVHQNEIMVLDLISPHVNASPESSFFSLEWVKESVMMIGLLGEGKFPEAARRVWGFWVHLGALVCT